MVKMPKRLNIIPEDLPLTSLLVNQMSQANSPIRESPPRRLAPSESEEVYLRAVSIAFIALENAIASGHISDSRGVARRGIFATIITFPPTDESDVKKTNENNSPEKLASLEDKIFTQESLPQEGDDCNICLSSLSNQDKKTNCGHGFHQECLFQWLEKHAKCPTCRHVLISN